MTHDSRKLVFSATARHHGGLNLLGHLNREKMKGVSQDHVKLIVGYSGGRALLPEPQNSFSFVDTGSCHLVGGISVVPTL